MSKSAIKLAISNISNRTRIKGARKVVRKSSKTQQSKRFIRTSVVSVFRSREYQTQWLLKVVVDGIWKCLKMSWLTFIQRASFCWWKRSNKVLDLSWEMSGNVTNMHVVFINSFIDPLGDQRATRSHKVHSVLSVCVKHDCLGSLRHCWMSASLTCDASEVALCVHGHGYLPIPVPAFVWISRVCTHSQTLELKKTKQKSNTYRRNSSQNPPVFPPLTCCHWVCV